MIFDMRRALSNYIRENGIKQTFLAEKSGMKCDHLSRCLKKDRHLRADELMGLLQVLGLKADELAQLYPVEDEIGQNSARKKSM